MKFRRAEDRKMKFNRGDLCEARFHGNKWKKSARGRCPRCKRL